MKKVCSVPRREALRFEIARGSFLRSQDEPGALAPQHLERCHVHASGILIFRLDAEGISCVTTVCPPAFAWATR